jgi:hypothetical protein
VSPLSVLINSLIVLTTSAPPLSTQISSNSSSSSLLSSPRDTLVTLPHYNTVNLSCNLCTAYVLLSTNNATMSRSNAVSALRWISNRLRLCPTYSYALPTLGVKGTKPSTQNPLIQSKKAAQSSNTALETNCSCSNKVPLKFLLTIEGKQDTNTAEDVKIAATYRTKQALLYPRHLRKYAS